MNFLFFLLVLAAIGGGVALSFVKKFNSVLAAAQ